MHTLDANLGTDTPRACETRQNPIHPMNPSSKEVISYCPVKEAFTGQGLFVFESEMKYTMAEVFPVGTAGPLALFSRLCRD